MCKALAISGSNRCDGNTSYALNIVLDELKNSGVETKLIQLSKCRIDVCKNCMACKATKKCIIEDDFNNIFEEMIESDIIIIGSPVYSGDVSARTKLLMERASTMNHNTNMPMDGKIGASVTVARRAGALTTLDSINRFFLNKNMIVVGSDYWNVLYADKPMEVTNDSEGVFTVKKLGENIVKLVVRIKNNF